MTFPLRQRFPALTRKRLHDIQQQYGHDPVVRRLLWEIRCLQVVVMRARQLEQAMPPSEGTTDTGIIVSALRSELAAESWLLERTRHLRKDAAMMNAYNAPSLPWVRGEASCVQTTRQRRSSD